MGGEGEDNSKSDERDEMRDESKREILERGGREREERETVLYLCV
jgi:hypothetical protein